MSMGVELRCRGIVSDLFADEGKKSGARGNDSTASRRRRL